MRKARGVATGVVALLLALAPMVVWGAGSLVQTSQAGGPEAPPGMDQPAVKPVPPVPSTAAGRSAEGKIKAMAGNKLVLDNGTELTLPITMMGDRGLLKEGMTVKASYEEKNGEKIVTSMDVRPTEERSTEGKSSDEKPAPK